jgi:YD repeat-containing protein
MNKKIYKIIALLTLALILGCTGMKSNSANQTSNDNSNNIFSTGNSRLIRKVTDSSDGYKMVETYSYNDNNQILQYKKTLNTKVEKQIINTYDEEYNLIQKSVIDEFGRTTKTTYTYNDKGHLIKEEWMGEEGSGIINYKYDEKGRRIMIEEINHTEEIIDDEYYKKEITYDDDGDVIKEVTVERNGIQMITDYIYNKEKQIILIKTLSNTGWETRTTFTYSEDGLLLSEIYDSTDGIYYENYYSYNEKGLLIKFTSETSGEDKSIYFSLITETYEYDEDGNLVKKVIHDKMESIVIKDKDDLITETYKYDEKGNLIEKLIQYKDGKTIQINYYYGFY